MPNPHLGNSQQPHAMSDETRRAFLSSDREDLLAVLSLRFGSVPQSVQARIAACDDAAALERWILVAANVPDWASFLSDLDAGSQAFRLVGVRYEPNPTEIPTESGSITASITTPRRAREPREPHLPDATRPKEE
jgi:hypothetical protein